MGARPLTMFDDELEEWWPHGVSHSQIHIHEWPLIMCRYKTTLWRSSFSFSTRQGCSKFLRLYVVLRFFKNALLSLQPECVISSFYTRARR